MNNPLETAPNHVKLAVDLIMLLEQNELEPEEVLAALKIVESDFRNKLSTHDKE
ncbi:pleiotropic regulatory protein RsmS [Pseudoalteromonas byunsanensis]|uniref:pleiotropic regulatory protein RsmS n=1 Tax=Pseudoalteromonas byunsanensis TaxID=327939 RepID=UPI000A0774FA|nr:pleiotropic regulatory protein RsmS [Pseudoalteromonas byunsanensis]